jgi:deoxynucleoside triphosphate triphosphohydrolase SAMHD1
MSARALISRRSEFEEAITTWANAALEPYLAVLRARAATRTRPGLEVPGGHVGPRRKEFNDSVWRTIVLEPFEVVVLDSPLLQRLRRIKQLGVVDLIYPSAVHSRFEHTLGAVFQVTQLLDALLKEAPPHTPDIDVPWRNALRLATLCHDLGHGALSHVAENALKNFGEVEDVRLEFNDELGYAEPPSLSEIAAYYIVGSSGFRELAQLASTLVPEHLLPQDVLTIVQRAIVGQPIRDDIPLLQELVTGPFDGDKLDYMTRDAQMTGVPVVTDIHRLVQKVRALKIPEDHLPPEIGARVQSGHPVYTLTGIGLSGGRTLDELLIGKTLLFDKLYRHQKVRACEVMVAAIYQQLAEYIHGGPSMMPYRFADADLLAIAELRGDERFAATVPDDKWAVAEEISRRLRARDIFVRAYAFAQNMPLDPYRSEDAHWRGLNRLRLAAKKPGTRGELVTRLAGEIEEILRLLDEESLVSRLPGERLAPYMWIDPPQPPEQNEQGGDIVRAYLISDHGEWLRFRDDYAEAIGWSAAYPLTRDLGYLFTVPELAPYAFLAMEKLVRVEFDVKTPVSMLAYAKQRPGQIEELKHRLLERGFYTDAPRDLWPLATRLTRADVRKRLGAMVSSLSGYEGPVREGHLGKQASLINIERAQNWVKQFDGDDVIDGAMRCLERVQLLGRADLANSLRRFLEANKDLRGGSLVPLGEPKDSSSVLTYYAGDVGSRFDLVGRYLGEALQHGGPIVFVDDFIGSGRQAASIVEAWFGERTVDLKEERGRPLPTESQALLRQRDLAFAFTAGRLEGVDLLHRRCIDLELSVRIDVEITNLNSVFDEDVFDSQKQRLTFIERCEEVGRALLLEPERDHDEEWVAERALGYGNGGYLVVFPYNTPTATLTALWASGKVGGVPWEPLFPRRPKR